MERERSGIVAGDLYVNDPRRRVTLKGVDAVDGGREDGGFAMFYVSP